MLEAQELAGERGGASLYSALSFSLSAGGLLRVRGANGSGKTTLLRTLAGLTRPSAGSLRWGGRPIGDPAAEFNRQLLFIGHASGLKDELSVLENLEFSCRICELAAPRERCRGALARLDILRLAELPARVLSAGQRKRAALARLALAASLPLWLLDEPFAALDEDGIARASELCSAHLAAGGMLVLTSHQEVALASPRAQDLELRG